MKKIVSVQFILSTVLLMCAGSFGGIEGLFEDLESPESQDGLVLKIALAKKTYFFGEPVVLYGQLNNTTDNMIAVVLEESGLSGIDSKLLWDSSPLDGKKHKPSLYSSTLQNMFLIPGHGAVYFALPDKMFQIGRTKTSVQYEYETVYKQPPLGGIRLWQGRVKSNELIVVVEDKEILTPEEQTLVNEEIWRHIDFFSKSDWSVGYRAEGHLVRMSRHSVPILKKCLTHENSLVRAHSISALGRIANKLLAEEVGFERDVSSLDDLLSSYNRERDTTIKEKVVQALMYFKDVEPEKRALVVRTLQKAINQSEKPLRQTGAVVLLRFSKEDGIPVVIDKIRDRTYFGEGQQSVLRVLQEETGQSFGPSSKEWKRWWEENK